MAQTVFGTFSVTCVARTGPNCVWAPLLGVYPPALMVTMVIWPQLYLRPVQRAGAQTVRGDAAVFLLPTLPQWPPTVLSVGPRLAPTMFWLAARAGVDNISG